jgi:hypothetical protein
MPYRKINYKCPILQGIKNNDKNERGFIVIKNRGNHGKAVKITPMKRVFLLICADW